MPRKAHHRAEPIKPLNLTVEEAATIIGIGRTSTYELIRTGKLKAFKFGRLTRVTRAEAEQVAREIAGMEIAQPAEAA